MTRCLGKTKPVKLDGGGEIPSRQCKHQALANTGGYCAKHAPKIEEQR